MVFAGKKYGGEVEKKEIWMNPILMGPEGGNPRLWRY